MELSIVITSYNTSLLLQKCLQSVYKALSFGKLEKDSEIIVVDNASDDDSCQVVRKKYPKVKLICNSRNMGFAKANNQGLKDAFGEYILLLNSDTQVTKTALAQLLKAAKKEKEIGVVGGKLLNFDKTLQPSIGFFPSLLKVFFWMTFIDDLPILSRVLEPYHLENEKSYHRFQQVDWVSGAAMLVKKSAVLKAGFLDEKIFMYGEEVDWCYRIKKAGYKIIYTPLAVIYHSKGASGEGELSGIIQEFSTMKYFYKKYKTSIELILLNIILTFGALLRVIIFDIIDRNPKKAALYVETLKMAG